MPKLFKKPTTRLAQIEVAIALIIILIILSIGLIIYNNKTKQSQDVQRRQAVNSLAVALEAYYLQDGRGFYPPLANLQNSKWLEANVVKINYSELSKLSADDLARSYTNRDTSQPCISPDFTEKLTEGCQDFKLSIKLNSGEVYTRLSRNGL